MSTENVHGQATKGNQDISDEVNTELALTKFSNYINKLTCQVDRLQRERLPNLDVMIKYTPPRTRQW
jgi:hypothetical protein